MTMHDRLREVRCLESRARRLQWSIYTEQDTRAELSAAMSDVQEEQLQALRHLPASVSAPNSPVAAHVHCLQVEAHPDVSAIRALFDGGDDLEPARAADALIELCTTRSALARALGHVSYPQMALAAQCLHCRQGETYASVLRYVPAAGALTADAPSVPSIERYWTVYEARLRHGSRVASIDVHQLIRDILSRIGLPEAIDRLEIVVRDQPYAAGIAVDLSEGDERRVGILLRPGGVRAAFTAAHELGHALLYLQRRGGLPHIPAWLDESYARSIENDDRVMLPALAAQIGPQTAELWLTNRAALRPVEVRRIRASVLTEDCLWRAVDCAEQTRSEAIERVTASCRDAYTELLNTSYETPMGWALDSFRSIDPVYVHGYAMADCVAPELAHARDSGADCYRVDLPTCRRLARLAATTRVMGPRRF